MDRLNPSSRQSFKHSELGTTLKNRNFESIESFRENGFVIVRNILTIKEVKNIRDFILEKIYFNDSPNLYNNPNIFFAAENVLSYPEVYRIPFRKKVVDTLRMIHGQELFYHSDLHVQYNMFGLPGWHTDCDTEIPAAYLLEPGYKFAKCGIYLQDNTPEWGGGIGVFPEGHKFPLRSGIPKVDFFFKKLRVKLLRNFKKLDIDTEAGDMVIFDSRLPHCPTAPGNINILESHSDNTISGFPKESSKLVIYWNAGNIKMIPNFLSHASGIIKKLLHEFESGFIRDKEHLIKYEYFLLLLGQLKPYYPEDFPSEFVELADFSSVKMSCLGKEKCAEIKNLYQKHAELYTQIKGMV